MSHPNASRTHASNVQHPPVASLHHYAMAYTRKPQETHIASHEHPRASLREDRRWFTQADSMNSHRTSIPAHTRSGNNRPYERTSGDEPYVRRRQFPSYQIRDQQYIGIIIRALNTNQPKPILASDLFDVVCEHYRILSEYRDYHKIVDMQLVNAEGDAVDLVVDNDTIKKKISMKQLASQENIRRSCAMVYTQSPASSVQCSTSSHCTVSSSHDSLDSPPTEHIKRPEGSNRKARTEVFSEAEMSTCTILVQLHLRTGDSPDGKRGLYPADLFNKAYELNHLKQDPSCGVKQLKCIPIRGDICGFSVRDIRQLKTESRSVDIKGSSFAEY